jgi:DNA polymerase-1
MGPLVRNMFVPDNGNVFMSADFSSQEMRILAHYTKDAGLLRFFTDPNALDPYSETAIMVSKDDKTFNEHWFRSLPKGERKATEVYRDFKALVLGLGFGMGPGKYARNTGKTAKEGKANYDKYHNAFPGVARYQKAAAEFASTNGYITTLLGRRRTLYDINNSSDSGRRSAAERGAFNTPIQGSAADMAKKAALACQSLIDKHKWPVRIVLMVHDEIIFEMPIAWAQSHVKETDALIHAMENALPLIIPMKCSKVFESRWGEEIDEDDLDDLMDDIAA